MLLAMLKLLCLHNESTKYFTLKQLCCANVKKGARNVLSWATTTAKATKATMTMMTSTMQANNELFAVRSMAVKTMMIRNSSQENKTMELRLLLSGLQFNDLTTESNQRNTRTNNNKLIGFLCLRNKKHSMQPNQAKPSKSTSPMFSLRIASVLYDITLHKSPIGKHGATSHQPPANPSRQIYF